MGSLCLWFQRSRTSYQNVFFGENYFTHENNQFANVFLADFSESNLSWFSSHERHCETRNSAHEKFFNCRLNIITKYFWHPKNQSWQNTHPLKLQTNLTPQLWGNISLSQNFDQQKLCHKVSSNVFSDGSGCRQPWWTEVRSICRPVAPWK